MAGCVDMGVSAVQVAVDLEASCVGGFFKVASDGFSVMVEEDEI